MTDIKIKKLRDNAHLPTKGSEEAAAYDLYACFEEPMTFTHIDPGETEMVPTGITTEIPKGWVGLIFPRSGLSVKSDLTLANCVGVIDSDYRGEWFVPLHHVRKEPWANEYKIKINNGDRVAQVIFMKLDEYNLIETDELNDSKRGEGGFGSTGI